MTEICRYNSAEYTKTISPTYYNADDCLSNNYSILSSTNNCLYTTNNPQYKIINVIAV